MRWFAFCVWPAVWLFERIVTAFMNWGERGSQSRLDAQGKPEAEMLQELRAIAALARTSRLIGGREEGIILNAARLSSRSVSEIVLPAEHIAMLNLSDPMADSLMAAHLDMHTRFPVTARTGDPQGIVGYVNFKDIVAHMRLAPRAPSLHGIVRTMVSFSQDVLPIFEEYCTRCHGETRQRGGVALNNYAAVQASDVIVVQDSAKSLLVRVLVSGEMPDDGPALDAGLIQTISDWIDTGAPDN